MRAQRRDALFVGRWLTNSRARPEGLPAIPGSRFNCPARPSGLASTLMLSHKLFPGRPLRLMSAALAGLPPAIFFSELVKKSTALGISRSGGARNPHVFQHTLRLLVPSLGLAPSGLALRFAPGETVLRSGGKPGPGNGPVWRAEDATRPPFARDDFFTSSHLGLLRQQRRDILEAPREPVTAPAALTGIRRGSAGARVRWR